MEKIVVDAFGKVNLSLNIMGTERGMHLIDSVMASISLADVVTVSPRADCGINVTFLGRSAKKIDAKNNTAYTAAVLFNEFFGSQGVDITVEKRLPLAGGMGGSSADGAGVLRALCLLHRRKINDDIYKIAARVGADVPFLLSGGWARVRGFGEKISPIEQKKTLRLHFAAAFPAALCDTGSVYKKFDELTGGSMQTDDKCLILCDNNKLVKLMHSGDVSKIRLTNVLTAAAMCYCPQINEYTAKMLKLGAISAGITGSGSTVIGLFDGQQPAQAAVSALKSLGIDSEYFFA